MHSRARIAMEKRIEELGSGDADKVSRRNGAKKKTLQRKKAVKSKRRS
jgi:hypothetical protein